MKDLTPCTDMLTATRIDDPEVARLYAQAMVMVRPDGHVAWRSDRVDDATVLIDTVRGG